MTNKQIADKAEKIRLKRNAIFNQGRIKLVRDGKRGRMVPIIPDCIDAVVDANEYNKLADEHVRMKP